MSIGFGSDLHGIGMRLYGKIIGFPMDFVGFTYVGEMLAFVPSWGQPEANLSLLEANWVRLWTALGPTSSILELYWATVRRYWCVLGLP